MSVNSGFIYSIQLISSCLQRYFVEVEELLDAFAKEFWAFFEKKKPASGFRKWAIYFDNIASFAFPKQSYIV